MEMGNIVLQRLEELRIPLFPGIQTPGVLPYAGSLSFASEVMQMPLATMLSCCPTRRGLFVSLANVSAFLLSQNYTGNMKSQTLLR